MTPSRHDGWTPQPKIQEQPEPECDHDWHFQDDSFDHELGCEVIHYFLCEKCGATKPTTSADYGQPEP